MEENNFETLFTDEEKKEIDKEIENKLLDYEEKLKEKFLENIENQIEEDKKALDDVNIIVSHFTIDGSPYEYLRTEPLAFYKIKNFDVSIFSPRKNIIVLIEIEKNLSSSIQSKMSEFQSMCEMTANNRTIDSTTIFDYFSAIVRTTQLTAQNFDFVLASPILDRRIIQDNAENMELNLNIWDLNKSGTTCTIMCSMIKSSKTAIFNGLKDQELVEYLKDCVRNRIKFSQVINFIFTTSNYLKAINITVPIILRIQNKKDFFVYEDWEELFKMDLTNYNKEEKVTIFTNYIDFGKRCQFIEERGNGKYRIRTRYTRDIDKLQDDIKERIILIETAEPINNELQKIRSEIILQWSRKKYTGGKTLFDFTSNLEESDSSKS